MNLRQMEVFRAVMSTGTVAGAATLLHLSQPAVSKALSLAERQSGIQLFDRIKGRLIPTTGARLLYEEVDRLWRGVEKVRKLSLELAHPADGTLHIAASSSLGSSLVPAALAEVYEQFPNLKAKVDLQVPRTLIDTLVDYTSDVGVALFALDHPNLLTVARYDCGWVCVMPKGHPLAELNAVRPRDLRGYRLISFPSLPDYGVEAKTLFGAETLQPALEVRAGQSACLFALAGIGVAVVDEVTVARNVFPQLEVRPFRTRARLEIRVVRNAFKPLSPFVRAFCDAIEHQWLARERVG
ncbi:MAG: LysR family transcriptional regulator [Burkholderiales bacterium]|nr:LysR family transcriptional regulator [Burkholderiales bacterium]ODU71443.1 MAG: hypothetical protein ABT05_01105 [Lautropia sp. SCN 66-9]